MAKTLRKKTTQLARNQLCIPANTERRQARNLQSSQKSYQSTKCQLYVLCNIISCDGVYYVYIQEKLHKMRTSESNIAEIRVTKTILSHALLIQCLH